MKFITEKKRGEALHHVLSGKTVRSLVWDQLADEYGVFIYTVSSIRMSSDDGLSTGCEKDAACPPLDMSVQLMTLNQLSTAWPMRFAGT